MLLRASLNPSESTGYAGENRKGCAFSYVLEILPDAPGFSRREAYLQPTDSTKFLEKAPGFSRREAYLQPTGGEAKGEPPTG